MTLRFNVVVQNTSVDYPPTIVRADVLDEHSNLVKSKAYIDKKFPARTDDFGELIHEIVDDMFPKKSAPEKPETKTQRGKSK